MMYDWYLNMLYRHLSPRSTILAYHRVANIQHDPYPLSVSPDHFSAQLSYLKANYAVVPLSELVSRKHFYSHNKPLVAITFDDGYADNLIHAAPLLHQAALPATVFVTVGWIGKRKPFYWDANTPPHDRGRALSRTELKKLANYPNITIGSHTLTHPHLNTLSTDQQKYELAESKKYLEQLIGKPVNCLSYPFGGHFDLNIKTARIAEDTDYAYACANWSGNVTLWDNKYLLPRRLVRNWDLPEFIRFMQKVI